MSATTLASGRHDGWEDVAELQDLERCPVNECGRGCKGKLMCSSHWRLVEHGIRQAMADALRDYKRADRAGDAIARHAAIVRWDAAACRAIHCAEVHERG